MRPTHARGKQSGRSLVEAKADCVTERDINARSAAELPLALRRAARHGAHLPPVHAGGGRGSCHPPLQPGQPGARDGGQNGGGARDAAQGTGRPQPLRLRAVQCKV